VLVGDSLCVPLVVSVPVQPPLAVQEVALVLDQVRVALLPDVMVVGSAAKLVIRGAAPAGFTVIVAVLVTAVPADFVTVSV
jgi:hypothetical protein